MCVEIIVYKGGTPNRLPDETSKIGLDIYVEVALILFLSHHQWRFQIEAAACAVQERRSVS